MLTQFTCPEGETPKPTLARYIEAKGVYAAGRLDYDSEGLLLLTNDGSLQHRLTDPRYRHPRTYWVQVEGTVTESALQRLRNGILFQGKITLPCEAAAMENEPAVFPRTPPVRFRRQIPTSWLTITLTEGRNRQVRRMTAAVGLPTLRLIRRSSGPVTLEGLAPGEWRELTPAEVKKLKGCA